MTSTSANTASTAAKKDVQKLQRAIIDGLEDVKAQDIQVFDTEHITSLFERVIIASGTSNRQTKALAASVRDAVRDAGFAKPRIEGEENGEWIIVDCGAAVAHIMQPVIRQYYHLEELWATSPSSSSWARQRRWSRPPSLMRKKKPSRRLAHVLAPKPPPSPQRKKSPVPTTAPMSAGLAKPTTGPPNVMPPNRLQILRPNPLVPQPSLQLKKPQLKHRLSKSQSPKK